MASPPHIIINDEDEYGEDYDMSRDYHTGGRSPSIENSYHRQFDHLNDADNPFSDSSQIDTQANSRYSIGSQVSHTSRHSHETSNSHNTHSNQSGLNVLHRKPPPSAINSKSLVDEAAQTSDMEALREGLSFALGGANSHGNWLPEALTLSEKDHESVVEDPNTSGYAENIQLHNLLPLSKNKRKKPKLQINTDIPLDLENGLNTSTHNLAPQTPSVIPATPKFQDILVRISDRIAGSGTNVDEVPPEQPQKTPTSPRSPRLLTPTSPSKKSFLSVNDNLDPRRPSSPAKGLGLFTDNGYESAGNEVDLHSVESNNLLYGTSSKREEAPKDPEAENTLYLFGNSLKLFSPNSRTRQICHKILSSSGTNQAFLSLLVLQVALLTYRQWNPLAMKGYYYAGYNWADYILIVINIIYTIEIVGKIIAYGFWDDHIMYEELGIPYPENEIKQMFFNFSHLRKMMADSHFSRVFFRTSKPLNSNDDLDSKSNNINRNVATNKRALSPRKNVFNTKKFKRPHLFASNYNGDSEEEISLTDAAPTQQNFTQPNTFYRTKASKVDKLKLKRAYIRSSWHRIDFFSMIMFWISLLISIDHYDAEHHIMIFRALSCLRILRFCNLTSGTTTILTSLKNAIPQLMDVAIFIACFWLFFGIIGVQSFSSSLTRHCVWTNPLDATDTWVNSDQYCGSYLLANGTVMPYILRNGKSSALIKGFRCPINSQCVSGDNPYGGTVNFDNILQSLEMVFVVMSANTFTDIMYDTMDSDTMAASLFFIFTIFILTVWLLNVFIAVIVASFNDASILVAEERKKNQKSKMFDVFNSNLITSKREKLEQLRKNSLWLRTYYKLDWIFAIVIMLSLFVQCFRTFEMSDVGRHTLYRFESAFTVSLLVEIILRFALHFPQWRLFFYSKRNLFDLLLAVITSIIILGPVKTSLGWSYYWLTVFQIMRFYRVVLATSITRNLWMQIISNFKALFDLVLFFFILTFLISIITARLFEGQIPQDAIDNSNFPLHTLPNTFLGLYVITSTENWTDVLYNLSEAAETVSQRAFGSMLLISWFIFSNTVIMNIFIAIIAKTLEVSEYGKRKQQLIQFIENMTLRLKYLDTEAGVLKKYRNRIFKTFGVKNDMEKAVVNLLLSGTAVQDFLEEDLANTQIEDEDSIKELPKSSWKRWFQVTYWRVSNFTKNPFFQVEKRRETNIVLENFDPAKFAKTILSERNALISQQNKFLKENPRFNNVAYIMSPRHKVRRFCQRLVKPSHGERIDGVEPQKEVWELFVIIIFLATIALVVTACYLTPLYRVSMAEKYGRMNWTSYLEIGFLAFFSVEFVIKVLADGLLLTPNAYLRSSWNCIDFIVLISLWVEFIALLKNNGNAEKIVRGLKALRALRLLTVSETAKNNFHNTIISGFWKIVNAGIISLCLLFPFSIWALNVFNGRLGYCIDGVSDVNNCYNEYSNEVFNWEIMSPNVYTNPQLEFDKFTGSFATLFEIVSLEGWVDLLENLMQSTGVGTVPEKNSSPLNGVFLVVFNFASTVFILTLFVSVIISNYSKSTGRAYQTHDQIAWTQVANILGQVKPSKRKDASKLSTFRKFCYLMTVEKNKIWHEVLNCILFLHVVSLLMQSFPVNDNLNIFRKIIFLISSTLFLANALMLLFGQGFKTFIKYKWNNFYLFVSFGAFTTTLIGYFVAQTSAFTNVQELFLVGLLTFIIPRSNRLSQLLRFASASLPTLFSLLFTWGVVFLLFAIAMNQIFGLTRIGPNGTDNLNLRSVPKALIVLFRCSFGEGWNYIMEDYTVEAPFCTTGSSVDASDCGNKQYAYILFCAWNILSMYIFLNMFVSLILDSFNYVRIRSGYGKLIEREEIRKFKRAWQAFDTEGKGYISPAVLPKFLHSLKGALSFHFYTGDLEIPELCERWIIRNNPNDPYDVTINHEEVDKVLENLDVDKIRERRRAYEQFVEEALLKMELNNDPGISFTRILLQLPLYTSFDAGQCLNLFDFLERRLLLQKVDNRLKTKRVYELVTGFACRWKYQENKKHGIRDSNIGFDSFIRGRSYFENPDLRKSNASEKLNVFETDNNSLYEDVFADRQSLLYDFKNTSNGGKIPEEGSLTPLMAHESSSSGVYIPNSPLNTFKRGNHKDGNNSETGNSMAGQPLPKLYMEFAQSANLRLPFSHPDDTVADDPYRMENPSGMIDLTNLGDTLSNSSWDEVYKEVQNEHTEAFKPPDNKSD